MQLGLVTLPSALAWLQIIGVGILAGAGFTMSLFITGLAFTNAEVLKTAKLGVLCASILAALIATYFFGTKAKSCVVIKLIDNATRKAIHGIIDYVTFSGTPAHFTDHPEIIIDF